MASVFQGIRDTTKGPCTCSKGRNPQTCHSSDYLLMCAPQLGLLASCTTYQKAQAGWPPLQPSFTVHEIISCGEISTLCVWLVIAHSDVESIRAVDIAQQLHSKAVLAASTR